MPQTKTKKLNRGAQKTSKPVKAVKEVEKKVFGDETEEETDGDVIPAKKKIVEIDEPEPVGVIDEKVDDDAIPAITEDGELEEETSMDTEEIDPFNDKWEQ